jgi:hypothetical protein
MMGAWDARVDQWMIVAPFHTHDTGETSQLCQSSSSVFLEVSNRRVYQIAEQRSAVLLRLADYPHDRASGVALGTNQRTA